MTCLTKYLFSPCEPQKSQTIFCGLAFALIQNLSGFNNFGGIWIEKTWGPTCAKTTTVWTIKFFLFFLFSQGLSPRSSRPLEWQEIKAVFGVETLKHLLLLLWSHLFFVCLVRDSQRIFNLFLPALFFHKVPQKETVFVFLEGNLGRIKVVFNVVFRSPRSLTSLP